MGGTKEQVSRLPVYNNLSKIAQGSGGSGRGIVPGAVAAPIGLYNGATNLGQGAAKLASGDSLTQGEGAVQALGGAGAATAGAIGTAGVAANALAGGGTLATALAGGTAGTGMATAVGAAGAAPVLATAGAGLATGVAVGNRGQQHAKDGGYLGQNADGSNRDWSDWGVDGALDDQRAWTDLTGSSTVGTVAGYASLAGRTVAGAAGAAATGLYGLGRDAVNWITSW